MERLTPNFDMQLYLLQFRVSYYEFLDSGHQPQYQLGDRQD